MCGVGSAEELVAVSTNFIVSRPDSATGAGAAVASAWTATDDARFEVLTAVSLVDRNDSMD